MVPKNKAVWDLTLWTIHVNMFINIIFMDQQTVTIMLWIGVPILAYIMFVLAKGEINTRKELKLIQEPTQEERNLAEFNNQIRSWIRNQVKAQPAFVSYAKIKNDSSLSKKSGAEIIELRKKIYNDSVEFGLIAA